MLLDHSNDLSSDNNASLKGLLGLFDQHQEELGRKNLDLGSENSGILERLSHLSDNQVNKGCHVTLARLIQPLLVIIDGELLQELRPLHDTGDGLPFIRLTDLFLLIIVDVYTTFVRIGLIHSQQGVTSYFD